MAMKAQHHAARGFDRAPNLTDSGWRRLEKLAMSCVAEVEIEVVRPRGKKRTRNHSLRLERFQRRILFHLRRYDGGHNGFAIHGYKQIDLVAVWKQDEFATIMPLQLAGHFNLKLHWTAIARGDNPLG